MSALQIYQMGDDSHLYRDATEKVFILHKAVQYKVFLFVLIYYIMCIKKVFQWRPIGDGMNCTFEHVCSNS